MRKRLIYILFIILLFVLAGCGKKDGGETAESSTDTVSVSDNSTDRSVDAGSIVTVSELIEMTRPTSLVVYEGGFSLERVYKDAGTGAADVVKEVLAYKKEADVFSYSQMLKYGSGALTKVYFKNDSDDKNLYFMSGGNCVASEATDAMIDRMINESLLALEYYDSDIVSITKSDGKIIAEVDCKTDGKTAKKYTVTINSANRQITGIEEEIVNEDNSVSVVTAVFKYSDNPGVDESPKTELLEQERLKAEAEEAAREAAEQAEREAKEKAEREAREKAEREKKEREERERQERERQEREAEGSQGDGSSGDGSQGDGSSGGGSGVPETPPQTPPSTPPAERQTYGTISFASTDIYGNPVDNSMISGAKVVLVNMWEAWCGPCRNELPALQQLYETYKGSGLIVIGAYSDYEYEDTIRSLITSNGLTYPMIRENSSIATQASGYVPTTFLTDGNGNILTSEPYIGGRSFSSWESIVLPYLN